MCDREKEKAPGDAERKKVCVQVSWTGFIKFCSFDNIPAAVGVEPLDSHLNIHVLFFLTFGSDADRP